MLIKNFSKQCLLLALPLYEYSHIYYYVTYLRWNLITSKNSEDIFDFAERSDIIQRPPPINSKRLNTPLVADWMYLPGE